MKLRHDWKALVRAHARRTGAPHLPAHTLDELSAHVEDIYLEAIRDGRGDAEAMAAVNVALAESPLASVPASRTRPPDMRPHVAAPERGWTGGFAGIAG